jgi:uroporphyrinogen-III synthase
MARLIEKFGGVPTIAPSMREIPLTDNADAFAFAADLLAGRVEIVIFMTGVGTSALFETLQSRHSLEEIKRALADCLVVVRGPKPTAVLQKEQVRIDLRAPEPNTWREIASELERQRIELAGKRVSIQEYGEPGEEFYAWLRGRGADVTPVPIYRWGLPEETGPLEDAVRSTVAGQFDVLLWTSAQQATHVLQVADRLGLRDAWLAAANQCVLGSIGPTASERLRSLGLEPDLEPTHPKMAHLVRETLEYALSK